MVKFHNFNFSAYNISIGDIFFYLGFSLLPFYFFPSGGPQLSTFLFFISGLFFFKNILKNLISLSWINLFFVYSATLNILFYFIYNDISFLNSIYQLFFAFFIYHLSYYFFQSRSETLSSALPVLLIFIIFFYLISYLRGLGGYFFGLRYNGFFNDPNQMAFYFLLISIFLFKIKFNKLILFSLLVSSLFLILTTMSRSALIPVALLVLYSFLKLKPYHRIIFTILGVIVFYSQFNSFSENDSFNFFLNRFDQLDFDQVSEERGVNHLNHLGLNSILGVGQGAYYRFNDNSLEIHNSFVALFVYYGFFGSFLFFNFIRSLYNTMKNFDSIFLIIIFLYSMFTFAFRTPIFWITISFLRYSQCSNLLKTSKKDTQAINFRRF